jgi:hypothetical protein
VSHFRSFAFINSLLSLLSLLSIGCADDPGVDENETETTGDGDALTCEVAIIGGGAGGLHTAYRLAPELGEGICLFEAEATLGGRIHDISLDENDPNSPLVGTGARRVMEGQDVLLGLVDELGIELETPGPAIDLIYARDTFAFSKNDFAPLYDFTPDPTPGADQETFLYDQLRFGPAREMVDTYPNFEAYVIDVVGQGGYDFLRDMSRFRADFEYDLDARGYLDYLDEEWDVCCTPSYPVGGMSAFIRGMASATEASGGRIFTSEPVSSIRRAEAGGYQLDTASHSITADKIVIAIPPLALDQLDGDIVDEIQAEPIYQDIVAVKVVTITQWWPESWWADIVNPDMMMDNHVWRAWSTDNCLNFIEIPIEPYAAAAQVTRSVYNDNLMCSEFWEMTAAEGTQAVETEVAIGLMQLFNNNGITSPAMIDLPVPLSTHVQVWPAAWHWLGAGTEVTNAELFEWAVEPLPGEEVALVGEAYNVQRSGWSDAAYKSSINLLNTRYGMALPGL